jgi:hypothetical protein
MIRSACCRLAILLARQFCDCLCDRINDFIGFGDIDFA